LSSDQPSPGADRPDPRVDQKFIALLQRIRDGDTSASTEFYNSYHHKVLTVVRRLLSPRLRPLMDSVDLTQDVWKSFFITVLPRESFANPEELLKCLAAVCRNKVSKRSREHFDVQKRSLFRAESIEQYADEILNRPGRDEDPGQRAESEDEWASILRHRPDRKRLILQGLRGGKSLDEIVSELQISVKTVRRVIEGFRNQS
jgi:RNA polymerase sigma factor (sigma-70 family)